MPAEPDRAGGAGGLALALGIAAFGLYLATLAPSVGTTDSGELILAAQSLGIAHPPGFPLYVILAHLMTWLPFGNLAQRVNLLSAISAGLAVGLLVLVIRAIWRRSERSSDGSWQTMLPSLVGASLLATSRTFWSYATSSEVYTLNTLLFIGIWLALLRWCDGTRSRSDTDSWLYVAGFFYGLGLAVHHVTLLLQLPALIYFVISSRGWVMLRSRALAGCLVAILVGASAYFYLPIAAAHQPLMNWGNPDTWQRFWWHVTGRQYQSYLSFTVASMATEGGEFFGRLAREFAPPWFPGVLVLAVLGCGRLFRSDRKLFVTITLLVAFNLAYSLGYDIAEDQDAYQLPTFALTVIAAALGSDVVRKWVAARTPAAVHVVTAVLAALPFVSLLANVGLNDRRHDYVARDYVDNIFQTIDPGGMLLTGDWQIYAPYLYVRHVENLHGDAIVLDINQLRRSWYFAYLRGQYPSLMEAVASETDAFLEDLTHWEADPHAYAADASLNRRIDDRFHAMLSALVTVQMRRGPLYLSSEIVTGRNPQDRRLSQMLSQSFQLVPQGLVFQAFADRDMHVPKTPKLSLRGLADGTMQFADDSAVRLKILPTYTTMLFNRGRYLQMHKDPTGAAVAYRASLAIDSNFDAARQALESVESGKLLRAME